MDAKRNERASALNKINGNQSNPSSNHPNRGYDREPLPGTHKKRRNDRKAPNKDKRKNQSEIVPAFNYNDAPQGQPVFQIE
jgi:hypothetical protein